MPIAPQNIYETTDAADSIATSYSMSALDTFYGEIDQLNTTDPNGFDVDRIAVELEAGSLYRFEANRSTLWGIEATLLDSSGREVTINNVSIDDENDPVDQTFNYIAETTGTYYVRIEEWNDYWSASGGTYSVTFEEILPGTEDEMAAYLTDGYWNAQGRWLARAPHSFDTSVSNEITVNLTGLSANGLILARGALEAWERVADIIFVETTGSADITIDDNRFGLARVHTTYKATGGNTTSATINVGRDLLVSDGSTADSPTYQAFIREIGHALGLGEQSNYYRGGFGDVLFLNESWQQSVMSGLSQTDNTAVDASFAYLQTAMMVDINAIQDLYGAPGASSATAGDTTYGANSNVSGYLGDLFSAMNDSPMSAVYNGGPVAMTIYDRDGVDTVDLRNNTTDDNVSLIGGSFSDVNGLTGNLGIAVGTVIENYVAGSGNDIVRGNSANNHIVGGNGNDGLYGEDGHDTLNGGNGRDLLSGGNGRDTLHGGAYHDTLNGGNGRDLLSGGNGRDTLHGGAYHDTLYGGNHEDRLYGEDGNDKLVGAAGNDLLYGGTGADRLYGGDDDDKLVGNGGRDLLSGGGGNDRLYGGAYHDTLYGGNYHDRLSGGSGNDTLSGGNGNDFLNGGQHTDVMTGGNGADVFHFNKNDDRDTVKDFQNNIDTIELAGFGLTTVGQALNKATEIGGDVVFDLGGGDVLTVENTNKGSLYNDIDIL